MTTNSTLLPVVAIPGLTPESLGNYLATLGLLRVLSRRWPDVRVAWREGVPQIVGGPPDIEALTAFAMTVAKEAEWTPYTRGWMDAQKRGTKQESGEPLAIWQASAEEGLLELFAAHAAPSARTHFNPLLGTGGNAGKRAFSDGWTIAIDALGKKPGKNKANQVDLQKELKSLLLGGPAEWLLGKLNAASWFSDANKLYNSGQRAYSDGAISPWAMVFACDGLPFFAGGVSRRLGARARAVGAFPFVTHAAAPRKAGEAGRDLAEVWAPLWERPMTVSETLAAFSRGRAEVGGHGASTPGAFAAAIMRRGTDAGITEFRRFVLARTTSANTFEPRFAGSLRVPAQGLTVTPGSETHAAVAFQRILALVDRLPSDKEGGKWRFKGLCGPIESAMVSAAARPDDPEAVCALMDAVVRALDRVDANKTFRKKNIVWEALPLDWLPALFGDEPPDVEARLALALVSAFPSKSPFALYRFGVNLKGAQRFVHPDQPPARWSWGVGPLSRVLAEVILRRTLDWEKAQRDGGKSAPTRLLLPVSGADAECWLAREVDEDLLARWLARLALFDWRSVPGCARALTRRPEPEAAGMSAALGLYGVLSPLFDLIPLALRGETRDLLDPQSGARTPAVARRIASLLRAGQVETAFDVARSRYAMANTRLFDSSVPWSCEDPERLLSSLLFPVSKVIRAKLVARWLRPQRQGKEPAHA